MKKTITIFALFLYMATATYAQKPFSEQTFNDLLSRYITTQSYDNFAQVATPDFALTGSTGEIIGLEGIEGLYGAFTKNTWNFSDIKTRQYGNTGIATFKVKHSHELKSRLANLEEVGTMVFVETNGTWALVSWTSCNMSKRQFKI